MMKPWANRWRRWSIKKSRLLQGYKQKLAEAGGVESLLGFNAQNITLDLSLFSSLGGSLALKVYTRLMVNRDPNQLGGSADAVSHILSYCQPRTKNYHAWYNTHKVAERGAGGLFKRVDKKALKNAEDKMSEELQKQGDLILFEGTFMDALIGAGVANGFGAFDGGSRRNHGALGEYWSNGVKGIMKEFGGFTADALLQTKVRQNAEGGNNSSAASGVRPALAEAEGGSLPTKGFGDLVREHFTHKKKKQRG